MSASVPVTGTVGRLLLPATAEPVSHADRAYRVLLAEIATCRIAPGAPVNERSEAARLGMSRTPIREALHRLAADGLVVTEHNRKVRASLLDPTAIREYTVVREAVEVELVRRLIEEDRALGLDALAGSIAVMDDAIRSADPLAFLEADEEFHLAVYEASGNRRAVDVIKLSWIHINRSRYLEPQSLPTLRVAQAEHRRMFGALRDRRPARAEQAVRDHMRRSRHRLEELMTRLPESFVSDGAHSSLNGRGA